MTHPSQTDTHEQDTATATRSDESPFIFEFFLIQGLHFRCMAYRDDQGKWRGAFNHLVLPEPVRVIV